MADSNVDLKRDEVEGIQEDKSINVASELMNIMVLPMALRCLVELGVFDVLAKAEGAKLSAKDIAIQISSNNPDAPKTLDRLLRLLVSYSALDYTVDVADEPEGLSKILYGLNPVSKHFVTDADGVSFGNALSLNLHPAFCQTWNEMKKVILEGGIPFNRVHGMHVFEYSRVNPSFNEVFHKAMLGITTVTTKKILEIYKGFEGINTLVNVGGGFGIDLKLITSKYPNVHGINFDLPHVIQQAPDYPGVEQVEGDMFDHVPKGDAICLKLVLHDWSDEHCLKILKNCYEAIPDNGKLIVIDPIIPIVPDTTETSKAAFTFDLFMLTQNPGGKERTQQEFVELATKSGFTSTKFVCCAMGIWVMEFFK